MLDMAAIRPNSLLNCLAFLHLEHCWQDRLDTSTSTNCACIVIEPQTSPRKAALCTKRNFFAFSLNPNSFMWVRTIYGS